MARTLGKGAAEVSERRPSSATLQDQRGMADLVAAMAGDQRDSRVLDLALGWIVAAQLAHAFDDLQHAFDMGLRQLAARRVGRKSAAESKRTGLHEASALALGAEAVILELHQNHISEAIIELRGVDFARRNARHAVGRLPALLGGG